MAATRRQMRSGQASDPHLSNVAKHLILPEGIVATGWPAVQARAARLGIGFDAWQADLGRAILAKRDSGLYAAGVDGVQVSMPRQVGKTYLLAGLIMALATLNEGLFVLWTAHRTRTADETFAYMRGLALRAEVAPYVRTVRAANGQQEVSLNNGARILFGAREGGFGRGFAGVDVIVFDEAQILGQRALDDMVPAANTSPNPLILRAGTPPKPTDPSEAFTAFRKAALAGEMSDGLYVEVGADDDASPEDRKQWAKANPSYPRRTPESAILRMKRQLGEESFRREGLGIWDPEVTNRAIGARLERPGGRAQGGQPVVRGCAFQRGRLDPGPGPRRPPGQGHHHARGAVHRAGRAPHGRGRGLGRGLADHQPQPPGRHRRRRPLGRR